MDRMVVGGQTGHRAEEEIYAQNIYIKYAIMHSTGPVRICMVRFGMFPPVVDPIRLTHHQQPRRPLLEAITASLTLALSPPPRFLTSLAASKNVDSTQANMGAGASKGCQRRLAPVLRQGYGGPYQAQIPVCIHHTRLIHDVRSLNLLCLANLDKRQHPTWQKGT